MVKCTLPAVLFQYIPMKSFDQKDIILFLNNPLAKTGLPVHSSLVVLSIYVCVKLVSLPTKHLSPLFHPSSFIVTFAVIQKPSIQARMNTFCSSSSWLLCSSQTSLGPCRTDKTCRPFSPAWSQAFWKIFEVCITTRTPFEFVVDTVSRQNLMST